MENLGLDLDEYTLTESERVLKRQGVTHLWCPVALDAPPVSGETAGPVAGISADRIQTHGDAPPLSLPPLFTALFHGKHPPVRTLWTYPGLAQDLARSPEPLRLTIFRKIQDAACLHLKWSQDDICVWPLDYTENVSRAGLDFFRPQIVLCFGPPPSPGAWDNAKSGALCGADVLVLPSLDDMAANDRSAKNHAWKVLQSLTES
ncbi:MAG: hypothetical protein GXY42_02730 [Desulfovibrionales bacterium]|nr:hypothetical protein [Desulfovibrionales bacterium]